MKKAFLLFLMLIIACFIIIGCKDSQITPIIQVMQMLEC